MSEPSSPPWPGASRQAKASGGGNEIGRHGWKERFEPNPNAGGALPPDPNEKPVVAHQTIFLGGAAASSLLLPQVVMTATP